jgi:hypothetical protein
MADSMRKPRLDPWQLAGTVAECPLLGAPAAIDLAHPRLGLRFADGLTSVLGLQLGNTLVDLSLTSSALTESALTAGGSTVEPSESYTRGHDLVATYNETPSRPLRVQAYWHVAELAQLPRYDDARLIELQVSINTSLLDLRPTLDVVTQTTSHVERLTFGEASAFLIRFADVPYTYIEIPHPRDCARTAFTPSSNPAANGRTTIRHTLFGRRLEKGVIMRGRVRGALVPRNSDIAAAEALADDLLQAAPPLTT